MCGRPLLLAVCLQNTKIIQIIMILDIYFLICLYREIDGEVFLRPRTRNGIRNAMVVSFWSLLPSENNKRCNLLKHRRLERNEHFDTFRV